MWRLIEAVLIRRLTSSFQVAVDQSTERLRRLGVAFAIAQVGVLIGGLGVGFLLLSYFFYLSSNSVHSQSALLVGLMALLPMLGCLLVAGRLSRR